MLKKYIDYLKDNPEGYWFKVKLFGWGWIPVKWQGWVVIFGFIALIFLNALRLEFYSDSTNEVPVDLFLQTFILFIILLFICYKKGEKPRWQWGFPKKDESENENKK